MQPQVRPPRPSNPPPRSTIPPPRPVSPVANLIEENNDQLPVAVQPSRNPTPPEAVESMPDVTQNVDVDLLNLSQNCTAQNINYPPKEPSFDLLGGFETAEAQGSNAMPDLLNDSQTKPPGLDDIFGSFSGATANNISSALPDLSNLNFNAFSNENGSRDNNHVNFDPFDIGVIPESGGGSAPLQPSSKDTSPQHPQQPTIPTQVNKDPFANLGNLASGLNLNWTAGQTSQPKNKSTTPGVSPQYSSPTHQYGGFLPSTSATASPRAPSTPQHQPRSPVDSQQIKPDYSRANFDPKQQKTNGNTAGGSTSASNSGDIFADILGQQGYSFANKANQGPKCINEMRKAEMVKDMDPNKAKILEWVRKRL